MYADLSAASAALLEAARKMYLANGQEADGLCVEGFDEESVVLTDTFSEGWEVFMDANGFWCDNGSGSEEHGQGGAEGWLGHSLAY